MYKEAGLKLGYLMKIHRDNTINIAILKERERAQEKREVSFQKQAHGTDQMCQTTSGPVKLKREINEHLERGATQTLLPEQQTKNEAPGRRSDRRILVQLIIVLTAPSLIIGGQNYFLSCFPAMFGRDNFIKNTSCFFF